MKQWYFFAGVASFWVLVYFVVPRQQAVTHVIAFGDYGRRTRMQRQVADLITKHPHDAVLSLGDQFYSFGVKSVEDPLFELIWELVYKPKVPWYISIGNHDALGSIDALMEYSEKVNPLFVFPSRYYIREISGVTIIVLDSCSLVCGAGEEPELRCREWPQLLKACTHAMREKQMEWLREVLQRRRKRGDTNVALAVTHWSGVSYCGEGPSPALLDDVFPLLMQGGVAAVLHGHDHCLQHNVLRGLHVFGSGAGGYGIHERLSDDAQPNSRTARNVFMAHEAGILKLDIPVGGKQVHAKFINTDNQVLYQYTIKPPKF